MKTIAKQWEDFARNDCYSNSTFDDSYYVAFGEAMEKLASTTSGPVKLFGAKWASQGPGCSEDRHFYRAWFALHNLPGFQGVIDPTVLDNGVIVAMAISFETLGVVEWKQLLMVTWPGTWESGWAKGLEEGQNPDGSLRVNTKEIA